MLTPYQGNGEIDIQEGTGNDGFDAHRLTLD